MRKMVYEYLLEDISATNIDAYEHLSGHRGRVAWPGIGHCPVMTCLKTVGHGHDIGRECVL